MILGMCGGLAVVLLLEVVMCEASLARAKQSGRQMRANGWLVLQYHLAEEVKNRILQLSKWKYQSDGRGRKGMLFPPSR